jgi:anti-sigma factor RsiW
MNDEEFRELLADYVAGELDEERAAVFRAELEANEERRRLARELQAAAAALEANVVSQEEAERRTAALELRGAAFSAAGSTRRGGGQRRLPAVLRYAAVIVLAFGAGFLARGWQSESSAQAPPPLAQTVEINERYVTDFVKFTQSFPKSSTFSRSLLALARK